MKLSLFHKNTTAKDSQEMFPLNNKHLINPSQSSSWSYYIKAALGLAMVGALFTFALVVSVIHHHFYSQESREEQSFNVLLLGGVNQDNVPEFRLEMINLGYCPDFDENRIHIPQLPTLLLNLTARYSYSDDSVKICGVMEENRRHQCWLLRNGTSW